MSGKTSISTSNPYCSATDALNYCDLRPLCDLCNDGQIVAGNPPQPVRLTQSQLIGSTIFNEMLMTASGMIETALMKGNMYNLSDIDPNQGTLTGASRSLLKWLTAKLAEGLAIERRPDKGYTQTKAYDAIIGIGGWLDRLESGEKIFAFQEVADAGLMKEKELVEQDLINRQLQVTQARRYFGKRAQDWK